MRKGDIQLGHPGVQYKDTKANIEALADLVEGMTAYAIDTNEFGTYNGAAWDWGAGGAFGIPVVTSDPVSPADGEMWLLRETVGGISDGTPIGLLLALTYKDNAGTTSPLQLSAWDDVVNETIRYASL